MKLRVKMNKMFNIFCCKSHKGGSNDDKCFATETNKMLSCYKKNYIKKDCFFKPAVSTCVPRKNFEAFITNTTSADLTNLLASIVLDGVNAHKWTLLTQNIWSITFGGPGFDVWPEYLFLYPRSEHCQS